MIARLYRARTVLLSAAALVGAALAADTASAQYAQQPAASGQPAQQAQSEEAQARAVQQALGFPMPGYIGRSYLQVPGLAGNWRAADHRGWVSVDAHYWYDTSTTTVRALFRQNTLAAVPGAPASGAGRLVLSIDKRNPALPALMERCRSGAMLPEVNYAVSAARSQTRVGGVLGPGAAVPDYFEFTLRNVSLAACPVVDDAPEQAFDIRFEDIRWLNWNSETRTVPVTLEPALQPLPANLSGESRTWVMTWFALANDVRDDQCPTMNLKPTEDDYYRLVPAQEAAEERTRLSSLGGVNYDNGQMGLRGPGRLNATLLPGIVADPGQHEPQSTVARGLNLDGRNSREDYVSADGRMTGIDNQLFRVIGCNAGWQGHRGFMFQYNMEAMRNGQISMLVRVDGIDNMQNDREVYVTTLYSTDDMAKNGAGTSILHDYTFRAADDPQYTHYFQRVRGRIVDGVILTEPVDDFRLNMGRLLSPRPPRVGLAEGRMRLEIAADGTMRGVLAGYIDWREMITNQGTSSAEFSQGFQMPAVYNALRRNADGLRDPATGEFNGISAAYDMEGVPAFVAPTRPAVASVSQGSGGS